MSEKQSNTIGRGRGRGRPEPEPPLPEVDSQGRRKHSVSEKGSGNGGNGGNGCKRGMMRDNRPIPDVYTTKPSSVENSKMGTSGTKVALKANYFPFSKKVQFELMQYRVDFSPDIELAAIRKFLIFQRKSVLGGYVYDGASGLYLSKKLDTNPFEYSERSRDGETFKVTIKATDNVIRMSDGMGTQILNLILRRSMGGLNLQLVKRDFYDAKNKVELKDCNLELWPGYVTSIRQHENNVLLCCEISHKIMRNDTALHILSKCVKENFRGYQEMFMKEMIGTTVLTDYNNKTYRVDDVDWKSSPEATFETKNGPVSFIDYYFKTYQIKIKDRKQPMLISKASARNLRSGGPELLALVPELCRVTGLTDAMRNDFRMMRSLGDHTRINPDKRMQRLMDFNKRLQGSKESAQVLDEWNMKLDPNLVEFSGRQLVQEQMLFGNGVKFMNDDRVDWTSRLKAGPMFKSIPLKRWAIVYPKRNEQESEEFVRCLIDVGRGMQYEMSNPKRVLLDDDRTDTYVKKLQELINIDPTLIMCIVTNNKADRYAAIKRLCCISHAIPTQVVLTKTITPKKPGGVMSIASKVVIQLNCKLGGVPWMVAVPLSGLMTVGFDVTHDTSDRSKSYGAFIASMDLKENLRFYSAVSAHKNGEEMSNNIALHMVKALRCYRELYNSLPKRICIYRDGVGDGQIEYVHQTEVKMIKEKLVQIYSDCNSELPGMAFIIVSKRINTRIFLARGQNPLPGTIVDNTVTLPERYDFFLISQSVRQGTVSPTSYNVIHDTMGLPPDKLQILSYKLCHLYFNWSGTTRVPAVVQYAHKLAILVGQYLHQSPSNLLEKQLYFL